MDDVASAFMAAPFQAGGWDEALKGLARATRSSRMQLLGVGGAQLIPFNWTTDCPAGFVEGFVEIGGGDPAMNWRIAASDAPLIVASEGDYDRVRKTIKSSVYDDFVAQFGMPFGCQSVLYKDADIFIGLAALRTYKDGRTTERDREIFSGAAKHVLAAIRMQKAVEHQGTQLAAGLLGSMRAIAFIVDGRGRVGALTPAAEDWLRARNLLRLTDGVLRAQRPAEDKGFQQALGRILNERSDSQALWLGREDAVMCEMFALPSREWSLGFEPRALITLRPPMEIGDERAYLLKSVLGLTGAEADIAIRMGRGQSREAIARARGATFATVNAQLKAIFRKSGAHREGELIALVNKLLR